MVDLACLFGIFFMALTPQMCPAIIRDISPSEISRLTTTVQTEIDTSVQTINAKAAKFVPKVQELLDRLNKSAVTGKAQIDSIVKTSLANFESDVANFIAKANTTYVSECTGSVASANEAASEIMENVKSCSSAVINEADERIALTFTHIDSELDVLSEIQKKASKCTDSMKGTEPAESEARKAYNCAKQSIEEIQSFKEKFSHAINFVPVTILYRGWANQIACCTSMSEAENLKYATDLLYADIETCVSKSTNF